YGRVSSAMASGEGGSSAAATGSSGAPPTGPPAVTAEGSGAAASPSSATAGSGGQAPSGPSPAGGAGNGDHGPVNIPHAVGWLAGAAAAIGVHGGQRAVSAGRSLVTRAASAVRRGDSEST